MSELSRPGRRTLVLVAVAAAVLLAGCGSSHTGGSATPVRHTSGASSAPATSSANAIGAIKSAWVAFFGATTPADRKAALLQNGQRFAALIKAQANSPLAASSSATVQSVTMTGPGTARVTYSILLGGKPALADQTGIAVQQNGVWKVGDASFCALLALQNGGRPPTPCPTG